MDINGNPVTHVGNDLGNFTVESLHSLRDQVPYAALAIKNSGPASGTAASNIGFMAGPRGPNQVPEPGTLALMAMGLGLAGVIGRKRT